MPRRTKPRTRATKDELPRLYSEETVRLIATETGFVRDCDIAKLRRKIIAVVSSYLVLLDDEQDEIKASRRESKDAADLHSRGYPALHTEDTVRVPPSGRRKETSLRVLVSMLGAIFNEFSGEWPKREFDNETKKNIGRFEAFVYGVSQPLFDPLTVDHFIKWYMTKLKAARNS